ncbi:MULTISPECIES: hypothetical protein [unclassified Azospirillum]|jgi:hypothetical protein|uniref:hypothetical protein n=1 Tax=unclassified Azospirillum TaxID=2630922 RepID=UPI000B6BF093|nr:MULTISPECIES: hypothetical protein [unclassified Azospirillum]SNS63838.1 hypothetical protein SAMN05880556_108163 [Azospirillum sp. RU38E]SNS82897.1 hypothetical protein SAMN05880591_108163 [Azospirillum sp. RU37A]
MLTMPARVAIKNSDPREEIALILSWNAQPDAVRLAAVRPGPERRALAKQFYREAKQPLLQRLSATPGVRIVNALDGMQAAILAAEAKIWQQMLETDNSPLESGEIEVVPNGGAASTLVV